MTVVLGVDKLTYSRGKHKILNSVDIFLHKSQFIGLIGPNGTGKSTLLRLMAGLLKPDSGTIFYKNHDLNEMSALEVAKAITYMPQSTVLDYEFTVSQLVLMGRHPHRKKWHFTQRDDELIADKAMEQTGIYHLKDRYITSLSGGERQLVFLAKAITQQSEVILLDEPTSDLDIYHQVQIAEVIQELVGEGKVVLAAIHDINLATRYCDQLMLLGNGELISRGTPEEVITNDNLLKVFHTHTYAYDDTCFNKRQIIPYEINPTI